MLAKEWAFYYLGNSAEYGIPYVASHQAEDFSALSRFGLDVSITETDNNRDTWLATKDSIDRQVPALVWADEFYLPYTAAAKRARHQRRDCHHRHVVIVYGYMEDSYAWVMDSNYYTGGPIPAKDLERARSSREIWPLYADSVADFDQPIANRNKSLQVQSYEAPTDLWDIFRSTIIDYVQRAIEHEDGAAVMGISGGSSAIRQFASELRRLQQPSDRRTTAFLYSLIIGVPAERRLGASLFKAVSEQSTLNGLADLAMEASQISRSWLKIKMLCHNSTLADWDENICGEITERLDGIAEQEAHFVEGLRKIHPLLAKL